MILMDEKRKGATYFWADTMNSKEQVRKTLDMCYKLTVASLQVSIQQRSQCLGREVNHLPKQRLRQIPQ